MIDREQEFYDQVAECHRIIEEQEILLEELFKRIDEEREKKEKSN
jgi:hypothetical protein